MSKISALLWKFNVRNQQTAFGAKELRKQYNEKKSAQNKVILKMIVRRL